MSLPPHYVKAVKVNGRLAETARECLANPTELMAEVLDIHKIDLGEWPLIVSKVLDRSR